MLKIKGGFIRLLFTKIFSYKCSGHNDQGGYYSQQADFGGKNHIFINFEMLLALLIK
jgi:hypothetical protein